MGWVWLLLAGLSEVVSVIYMKESGGLAKFRPAVVCLIAMAASLYFLSLALTSIPVGTSYAVWTGIGSSGSIVAGILLYRESRKASKLIFTGMIVVGIIGLKWTS